MREKQLKEWIKIGNIRIALESIRTYRAINEYEYDNDDDDDDDDDSVPIFLEIDTFQGDHFSFRSDDTRFLERINYRKSYLKSKIEELDKLFAIQR